MSGKKVLKQFVPMREHIKVQRELRDLKLQYQILQNKLDDIAEDERYQNELCTDMMQSDDEGEENDYDEEVVTVQRKTTKTKKRAVITKAVIDDMLDEMDIFKKK